MNPVHNPFRTKSILWSSNPYDPGEYYADKLELLEHEDTGELKYKLTVGGGVIEKGPIVIRMGSL